MGRVQLRGATQPFPSFIGSWVRTGRTHAGLPAGEWDGMAAGNNVDMACPTPFVEGNVAFPQARARVARRKALPPSTPAVPLRAPALPLRARALRAQGNAFRPSTSARWLQAPAIRDEAGSVPPSTRRAFPRTPFNRASTTRVRTPSSTAPEGGSAMPSTRDRPPTLPCGDPDGVTSKAWVSRTGASG